MDLIEARWIITPDPDYEETESRGLLRQIRDFWDFLKRIRNSKIKPDVYASEEKAPFPRIANMRHQAHAYIDNRIGVVKSVVEEVRKAVFTGETFVLEADFPPSTSHLFEEKRRLKLKGARRQFLEGSFPRVRNWSEKKRVIDLGEGL